MLLLAAVCWGTWIVRNMITFDKAVVRSPMMTIASVCSFLNYWAGLFGSEDGELIRNGAGQLLQKASELMASSAVATACGPVPGLLMITNGEG